MSTSHANFYADDEHFQRASKLLQDDTASRPTFVAADGSRFPEQSQQKPAFHGSLSANVVKFLSRLRRSVRMPRKSKERFRDDGTIETLQGQNPQFLQQQTPLTVVCETPSDVIEETTQSSQPTTWRNSPYRNRHSSTRTNRKTSLSYRSDPDCVVSKNSEKHTAVGIGGTRRRRSNTEKRSARTDADEKTKESEMVQEIKCLTVQNDLPLTEKEAEIKRLQEEVAHYRGAFTGMQTEREEEDAQMKRQLGAKSAEVKFLQNEVSQYQSKCDAGDAKLAALNQLLRVTEAKSTKALPSKDSEVERLCGEVARYEAAMKELELKLNSTEKANTEIAQRMKDTEALMKSELLAKEIEVKGFQDSAAQFQAKLEETERERDSGEIKIAELNQCLKEKEEDTSKQLYKKSSDIKPLCHEATQNAAIRKEMEGESDASESKIDELSLEVERLEAETMRLLSGSSARAVEVKELEAERDENLIIISELNQKLAQLEVERGRLSTELDDSSSELKRLKEQSITTGLEIEQLQEMSDANSAEVIRLNHLLQEKEEKIADALHCQAKMKEIEEDREANNAKITELQGEVERLQAQSTCFASDMLSKNKEIDEFKHEVQRNMATIRELKEECGIKQARITELESVVVTKEEELKQTKSTLDTQADKFKGIENEAEKNVTELKEVQAKLDDKERHIVNLLEEVDRLHSQTRQMSSSDNAARDVDVKRLQVTERGAKDVAVLSVMEDATIVASEVETNEGRMPPVVEIKGPQEEPEQTALNVRRMETRTSHKEAQRDESCDEGGMGEKANLMSGPLRFFGGKRDNQSHEAIEKAVHDSSADHCKKQVTGETSLETFPGAHVDEEASSQTSSLTNFSQHSASASSLKPRSAGTFSVYVEAEMKRKEAKISTLRKARELNEQAVSSLRTEVITLRNTIKSKSYQSRCHLQQLREQNLAKSIRIQELEKELEGSKKQ